MMRIVATLPLLSLAACATAPLPPGAVRYRCEDGRTLVATWETTPYRVTITAAGVTAVLPSADMMSSVDYFGFNGEQPLRLNGSETEIKNLGGFPGPPLRNCRKA